MKTSKSKKENKNKKKLDGVVVSNKMMGAVVVKISRKAPHPKYGKIVGKNKRLYAKTDEKLEIGEKVTIQESRPLSKLIRWVVIPSKK